MSIKIYRITNHAVTPKKYYIGKTKNELEKRFLEHIRKGRRENNCLLHDAIINYGKMNFEIDLIEEVEEEDANIRETFYIKKYMSHYKDGNGYNMKYEINQNLKKYYHNADINIVKDNISKGFAWNKDIKFSEEAKEKVKNTRKHRYENGVYVNYGHKHTEETKETLRKKGSIKTGGI